MEWRLQRHRGDRRARAQIQPRKGSGGGRGARGDTRGPCGVGSRGAMNAPVRSQTRLLPDAEAGVLESVVAGLMELLTCRTISVHRATSPCPPRTSPASRDSLPPHGPRWS